MAYHQEVGLWVSGHAVSRKDAGPSQVLWQGNAEMRVVESSHVLRLCRVGNARSTGLDAEVCLSQAASLNENLDCASSLVGRGR